MPERLDLEMQKTIRIAGTDYSYHGLTGGGKGIRAGGSIFWMFPAVRPDGCPVEPLPPIGPKEIRCVTTEVPDLTARHWKTLQEIYDERRNYHATITYEEHIKKYTNDTCIRAEEFEKARKIILGETLKQFSASSRAKKNVWHKCGTDKLAEQVGLLNFSERLCLVARFQELGFNAERAWGELARLKYVALYDDPDETHLYLYDLKDEPDSMRERGAESAHERLLRKGRKRGGQRSSKLKTLDTNQRASMKAKYKEMLAKYPKSKIQAARRTAEFVKTRMSLEVDPKTIQNWCTGKTSKGIRKTVD